MLQKIKRMAKRFKSGHNRGQGLIETALLVPVLLMVLSGLVEFGFFLNDYLALQDAARNAARYAADGSYLASDGNTELDCAAGTRNFYRQTACLVNQELAQERPEIKLIFGTGIDDVVISVFSIAQDYCTSPSTFPPVQSLPPGSGVSCVSARHPSEAGWSFAQDPYNGTGAPDNPSWHTRNQSSRFSSAEINSRLSNMAPSTGLVIVELTYTYEQKLRLPWITAFISDPIVLHNYALMPLVSAEPTPTPVP